MKYQKHQGYLEPIVSRITLQLVASLCHIDETGFRFVPHDFSEGDLIHTTTIVGRGPERSTTKTIVLGSPQCSGWLTERLSLARVLRQGQVTASGGGRGEASDRFQAEERGTQPVRPAGTGAQPTTPRLALSRTVFKCPCPPRRSYLVICAGRCAAVAGSDAYRTI